MLFNLESIMSLVSILCLTFMLYVITVFLFVIAEIVLEWFGLKQAKVNKDLEDYKKWLNEE